MKYIRYKAGGIKQALKDFDGVKDSDLCTKTVRSVTEKDIVNNLRMQAVRDKGYEPVQIS